MQNIAGKFPSMKTCSLVIGGKQNSNEDLSIKRKFPQHIQFQANIQRILYFVLKIRLSCGLDTNHGDKIFFQNIFSIYEVQNKLLDLEIIFFYIPFQFCKYIWLIYLELFFFCNALFYKKTKLVCHCLFAVFFLLITPTLRMISKFQVNLILKYFKNERKRQQDRSKGKF